MYKLIAQMIGRNEERRYVRQVIERLVPMVDNATSLFGVHEGRLRQCAWENLGRHARTGDWVLAIDCDEKLFVTDPSKPLSLLLQTTKYHALGAMFYHMWNERQYRADKGWAPSAQARIYR